MFLPRIKIPGSLLLVFLPILAWPPSVSSAEMLPIFGPKNFVRERPKDHDDHGRDDRRGRQADDNFDSNATQTFKDSFENCETLAQYKLVVVNGNSDGTHRAKSFSVVLNRREVIDSDDLRRNAPRIEKSVHVLSGTNTLQIELKGALGSSLTVTAVCTAGCLGAEITNPSAGASIDANATSVTGTIASSADEVGVVVNAAPAFTLNGRFQAAKVPLDLGTNLLTATVTNACGNQATTAVNVIGATAASPPITFRLVPSSGVVPLTVGFTADVTEANQIANYAWDFDGDGLIDASGPNLSVIATTYDRPGLYTAGLTVTDTVGGSRSAQVPILVLSATEMSNLLNTRWAGFGSAIARHDIPGALAFVHPSVAGQFRALLDLLAQDLGHISNSLSSLSLVSAAGGVLEFVTTRIQNGASFVYFITFMQDQSGLWKIVAM